MSHCKNSMRDKAIKGGFVRIWREATLQGTGLKEEEETAVELESELPSPTCGLSSSESRGWDLPGVVKEP